MIQSSPYRNISFLIQHIDIFGIKKFSNSNNNIDVLLLLKKITNEEIKNDIVYICNKYNIRKLKDYKKYGGKYSQCIISIHYGSWTEALRELGFEPEIQHKAKKEDVAKDIIEVIEKTQCTKQTNYIENGKFSRSVIKRLFGTWNKALLELGYEINTYKPYLYNRQDIINNYIELSKEKGCPLTCFEFRKLGKYSQPIIDNIFGSFSNLLKELGLPVDGKFISNEEIKEKILEIYKEYGFLSTELLDKELKIVSYPTVISRFGKMKKMCASFGIPYEDIKESKFAKRCIKIIENIFPDCNYETEKSFPWLINPKTNRKLWVDMYIKKYKLCIEFDGPQHYKCDNLYCPTKEMLDYIKERDEIKNNLLIKHNFKIVRIPYNASSKKKIEESIKKVI